MKMPSLRLSSLRTPIHCFKVHADGKNISFEPWKLNKKINLKRLYPRDYLEFHRDNCLTLGVGKSFHHRIVL